jgi:hypothetical protein
VYSTTLGYRWLGASRMVASSLTSDSPTTRPDHATHLEEEQVLEERRQPYTPQRIRLMFPVLTEVECLMVADIEERFPRWHVWPHVDSPKTHLWLARRNFTSMNVLVTPRLADMPGEITNWINENSCSWPVFP